jgi:hypothetical protein
MAGQVRAGDAGQTAHNLLLNVSARTLHWQPGAPGTSRTLATPQQGVAQNFWCVCATSPARRTKMCAGEAVLRRSGVEATFARANGSPDLGTPLRTSARAQNGWGELGTSRTLATPQQGVAQNFWCVCATSPARRTGMRAGEAVLRRAGVGATFARANGSRDPGTPLRTSARAQNGWGELGTSRTLATPQQGVVQNFWCVCATSPARRTGMRAGEAVLRRAGVGATFARANGSPDPGTPRTHIRTRAKRVGRAGNVAHTRHTPTGCGSEFLVRVCDVPGSAHKDAWQGKRSCAVPGSGRPLRAKTAAPIPARPYAHPHARKTGGASWERRACGGVDTAPALC